jgi:hypothetical protein
MYIRYQQSDSINRYLLSLLDSCSNALDIVYTNNNKFYTVIAMKDSTIKDQAIFINSTVAVNTKLHKQNKILKKSLLIVFIVGVLTSFLF